VRKQVAAAKAELGIKREGDSHIAMANSGSRGEAGTAAGTPAPLVHLAQARSPAVKMPEFEQVGGQRHPLCCLTFDFRCGQHGALFCCPFNALPDPLTWLDDPGMVSFMILEGWCIQSVRACGAMWCPPSMTPRHHPKECAKALSLHVGCPPPLTQRDNPSTRKQ